MEERYVRDVLHDFVSKTSRASAEALEDGAAGTFSGKSCSLPRRRPPKLALERERGKEEVATRSSNTDDANRLCSRDLARLGRAPSASSQQPSAVFASIAFSGDALLWAGAFSCAILGWPPAHNWRLQRRRRQRRRRRRQRDGRFAATLEARNAMRRRRRCLHAQR